jgi:nitrite reductase/ring-hydroxylating ferredoxin subunit
MNRREFCRLSGAAVAAAAAAAMPACGGGAACFQGGTCGAASVATGLNAADVVVGTATLRTTPQANLFVCRDAAGIYAVDAGCTHLGCDVQFVSAQAGFSCACHGATYDFNGERPTAPAPKPLAHYAVCATPSGALLVDTEQLVDACARFKP